MSIMTLEDFFTLTQMKDGLTVPDHVEELITVMQKEKDSLLKSIGDATRQWAAVASTIAATENEECLDLFIQLDGLLFLDRWLKDAQAFPDELSDCFVEEAISALLQAVEKLQLDNEKLTSSGICITVKSLLNYKSTKVQDKAKALVDNWKAEDVDFTNVEVEKAPFNDSPKLHSQDTESQSAAKDAFPTKSPSDQKLEGAAGGQNKLSNDLESSQITSYINNPNDGSADIVTSPAKLDSIADDPMREKICSFDQILDSECVAASKQGSDAVTSESLEPDPPVEDAKNDNLAVTLPGADRSDNIDVTSASTASDSKDLSLRTDAKVAEEAVVKPEMEACDVKAESQMKTVTACETNKPFGESGDGMDDNKEKGLEIGDGSALEGSKDQGAATLTLEDDEHSVLKRYHKIERRYLGSSCEFARSTNNSKTYDIICQTQDMDLEDGTVDALEVARRVAKEVEREVVGYYEQSCSYASNSSSSSSGRISRDDIRQHDSPKSLNGGQDLEIDGPEVNQAAEADLASTPGQADTFSDMDRQLRQRKACENDIWAAKFQVDKSLARNTKSQIPDMFSTLGSFRKELDVNDAADINISRIVSLEPDDAKKPLPQSVAESSSLLQMVESLKAELEKLKKEHAELNEIGAESDFAASNVHCRLVKSKHDNGGRLAKRDKNRQILKEVTLDKDDLYDLRIKAKGLKREHGARELSTDVEKRPKIAVDEAKEEAISELNQDKSFPEGIFSAYVSTSESSARVMLSEDELESSSQQVGKSAKLEKATLAAAMGGVEEGKHVDTSGFSIRDFVFTARNKDISLNWPFSRKNLQLCLRHGVKDVLPPFHSMDSLRESSTKRCLDDKSLHSEESTLDEKALMLKNHHVPGTMQALDHSWDQELAEGYRDSVSLPIGGERDLAFKSIATTNSHSEVESVSTSNLPLSEVSDEREAAASAVNKKTKSSASQLSNKKSKVATKMRINSKRNTPEDITFACTVPSEAISSKICPVCENFSSSSNTTLNAHIDQCLSSQSPLNWVKSSKLVKPRIKPRKMRLMSDICATALCCTLEDLDRRNGTNWATNVDSPLEDATGSAEQENPGVSSRYIINDVDDGSVYIDSSGRKIRILSKLNDMPSSFSKAREDIRPKKQSRKGKRSKFLSSNRKKRLTKHLKYLKVTHQRKRLSSLKTKAHSTEACGAEETMFAVELKQPYQTASYVKELKTHELNHPGVEGTASQLIPLQNSNSLHKNDLEVNIKLSRNDNQTEKNSFIGNDQGGSAQVEPRGTPVKMHLNLPKRSLSSMQSNFRSPSVYPAETDQSGGSCRGKMDGPSLRRAVRGNREVCQASLKLGARGSTKESTPKCSDSATVSAPAETEVDGRSDALQNADNTFPYSQKLLHGSHAGPPKGMRSLSSNSNIFLPIRSRVRACQANSERIAALETSCDHSGDKETEAWSVDASQQSGSRISRPIRSRITDSLRSSSTIKVPQKQALKHGQDGSKVTNKNDELADDHRGNHGCVRSLVNGHHNVRDFIASVSPSSLAIGVNETKLRSDLDPELENVADVSSQITSLQHGPLSRAKSRGQLRSDPGLNHEREMFYRNAVDAERLELKTGDVILNFGHGSFFPEVDPIPIPGPPGSDLPCFSDMGSDDQFRSSLSSCLAQPSGDGDNVVDRDLSHSPSFATSSISNLCRNRKDDPTANEQESLRASLLVPDNVYSWWLGACSGPFSTVPSQFTAADIERATCVSSSEKGMMNLGGGSAMLNCDDQQCCSQKEEITRSSINSEETQLLGWKQTSSRSKHGYAGLGGQVNGLNDRPAMFSSSSYRNLETSHQSFTSLESTVQAAVPFLRTGEYDSSSPSAPILRLMGKDLMVSNRVDTDLSRSQAAMNVGMNKLVKQSWELQPSQIPAYMKPVLHEQDPRYLSVRHFDSGSSNVIHNYGSNHQASGGFYNYDRMHASFSVLGATPSQR